MQSEVATPDYLLLCPFTSEQSECRPWFQCNIGVNEGLRCRTMDNQAHKLSKFLLIYYKQFGFLISKIWQENKLFEFTGK